MAERLIATLKQSRSKRRVQPLSIVLVASALFSIVSCSAETTTSDSTTTENSGTQAELAEPDTESLQVVTTFLPITQFTNAVAGDRAEVTQLLPTNVGPHDYQAKPGDVQAIATADVLVKNGLEMEFFLDDMIGNAENADLVIIDSSEDVATLAFEDGHDHGHAKAEDHDHGHDHAGHDHDHDHDHAGHDHDHDHDHAEAHDHDHDHDHAGHDHDHHHGHSHGEFDPHVWLDPKRAVEQVENIRDGLIAADPGGEAEYTANAEAFIAELETLDSDISEQLAPFEGQTFVVFHDFASYFAESYGLQSETLVGIPEESPSPEDVKRVMEAVQAEGLKAIMTEPQAGQASFEAIANDLNIGVGVFDPLETGSADATQSDYYLTIMRQNVESLVSSFEISDQAWLPLWVPQPVAAVFQHVSL
ncbi:MAG: zinc ABC transporter solute-binding protein [Cyanothece sp. SIO2G6]|nr:zinc ABC transporter solute-binding protein [Cyanothece sp. SIO2G6]